MNKLKKKKKIKRMKQRLKMKTDNINKINDIIIKDYKKDRV